MCGDNDAIVPVISNGDIQLVLHLVPGSKRETAVQN
jgi:hypothetical protein